MEEPKDRKEDFRMLSSRPDASAPIMNSMQLNLPTPTLHKTGPLSITPAWGGARGTLLTELLLASCQILGEGEPLPSVCAPKLNWQATCLQWIIPNPCPHRSTGWAQRLTKQNKTKRHEGGKGICCEGGGIDKIRREILECELKAIRMHYIRE